MDLYVHQWLFGKQILDRLIAIEENHSEFMSTFGDYPAIVITKNIG